MPTGAPLLGECAREGYKPEPRTESFKRLTIDMPTDLHTQLKVECATKGEKMSEWLRRVIAKELKGG